MKIFAWFALGAPVGWLTWQIFREIQLPTSALGADPGEAVVHYLGIWSLRTLLIAFAVTPLARVTGNNALIRLRRMAGLWAYTYVSLHLLAYLFFYVEFSWAGLLDDVFERSYITVGIGALLCLTPMALTSTRGWQQRLRRNWKRIHLLVYPALALGIVHFFWLTRDQYAEVFLYLAVFLLLLVLRLKGVAAFRRRIVSRFAAR